MNKSKGEIYYLKCEIVEKLIPDFDLHKYV